jgi:hypothetical protein
VRRNRLTNARRISNLGWEINQSQASLSAFYRSELRVQRLGINVLGADKWGFPAEITANNQRQLNEGRISDFMTVVDSFISQNLKFGGGHLVALSPTEEFRAHISDRLERARELFVGSERLGFQIWSESDMKKWESFFQNWTPEIGSTWSDLESQLKRSRSISPPSDNFVWSSFEEIYFEVLVNRRHWLTILSLQRQVLALLRLQREQVQLQSIETNLRIEANEFSQCGKKSDFVKKKVMTCDHCWEDEWVEVNIVPLTVLWPLARFSLAVKPRNFTSQIPLQNMKYCNGYVCP